MLPDSWKGYPTMQELNNKITTSMPLHKFVIYGDIAIIYPKNSIIFSDTILSMTNSLLYFDDNNSNLAQDAELKIAYNSTEKERREIIRLCAKLQHHTLLAEHLKIWAAMAKIGQKKYSEALKILKSLDTEFSYRKLKRIEYYKELCNLKLRKASH